MKLILKQCVILSLLSLVVTSGVYTTVVWSVAQITPLQGHAQRTSYHGVAYYSNIAQYTSRDDYFSVRPSAVQYNAAGSGGSNMAVCSPEYRAVLASRVDSFLVHNPDIHRSEVPMELLSASGSGLDPDITVESALIQVKRVARSRHLNEQQLQSLVWTAVDRAFLGCLGPQKVNVLRLNIALDSLSSQFTHQ